MARRKEFKSHPQKTGNVEQAVEKPPSKLRRWAPLICVTAATLIFLAIYILRLDQVVGMVVDDAWYVLLAKALATGQGYRIINAPGAQIMPLYPPGFPFLLSFVFRIAPQFPENYWLLKAVSIAAMMGTG